MALRAGDWWWGRQQDAFLDKAKFYNWPAVWAELRDKPHLVDCNPAGRYTALHQAAESGNVEAVQRLLSRVSDRLEERGHARVGGELERRRAARGEAQAEREGGHLGHDK